MLLGKRPRPPIKRTTSMTEFTFDISSITEHQTTSDPHQNPFKDRQKPAALADSQKQSDVYDGLDQRFLSTVSPRNHRCNSADFVDTAHFLRSCGLCKRRLVPARDIYMYKGDSAFCSLECRQQQMDQDERKDKSSLASKKEAPSSTAASKVSTKAETVAAV